MTDIKDTLPDCLPSELSFGNIKEEEDGTLLVNNESDDVYQISVSSNGVSIEKLPDDERTERWSQSNSISVVNRRKL